MSKIEATTASQYVPLPQDPAGPPADLGSDGTSRATGAAGDTPGIATSRPSTEVRISMSASTLGARRTAKEAAPKDSDIDNSNLPDNVKNLLKRMRELREKLEEKVQQLQELSHSTEGTPEQRRMRIEALNSEVSALTAAMSKLSADLAQATRKFTSDQKLLVGSLVMS